MEIITDYVQNYVLPIMLITTLFIMIFLLLNRFLHDYNRPFKEVIRNKTENFLTEMILSNINVINLKTLSVFKNQIPIHKPWCKEMIINILIQFKESLKGKAANQINVLYKELNLYKYSSELIRNYKSFYKCEGFYHFQALNYKEGSVLIKPYLKDPNMLIRSNANMAYIRLEKNHIESFKELSSEISDLNMIKIIDIIRETKISIPINLDQWIETETNFITKLGLKLMVYYNYGEKSNRIVSLIHNEDDSVKIEAITAIRELFLIDAKEDLISLFDTVSFEVQLEILQTLKVIGDESIIPFLVKKIHSEINNDIKLKAVDCLNTIDKTALDVLITKNLDAKKMANHVRDIYL